MATDTNVTSYYTYIDGEMTGLVVVWCLATSVVIITGLLLTTIITTHHKQLATPANIMLISLFVADLFAIISRLLGPIHLTLSASSGREHSAISGLGAARTFSDYLICFHMLLPALYIISYNLEACKRDGERRFHAVFTLFKTILITFSTWYLAFLLALPLFMDQVVLAYQPDMITWYWEDSHRNATGQHLWYSVVRGSIIVLTLSLTAVCYVFVIVKRSRAYHFLLTHSMRMRVHPFPMISASQGKVDERRGSAATINTRVSKSATSSNSDTSVPQPGYLAPSTSNGVRGKGGRGRSRKSHTAYMRRVISTIEDEEVRVEAGGVSVGAGEVAEHVEEVRDDMSEVMRQSLIIYLPFLVMWLLEHLVTTLVGLSRIVTTTTDELDVRSVSISWQGKMDRDSAKRLNSLTITLWALSYCTHFIVPMCCQSQIKGVLVRWSKVVTCRRGGSRDDEEGIIEMRDDDEDVEDDEEEEEEDDDVEEDEDVVEIHDEQGGGMEVQRMVDENEGDGKESEKGKMMNEMNNRRLMNGHNKLSFDDTNETDDEEDDSGINYEMEAMARIYEEQELQENADI